MDEAPLAGAGHPVRPLARVCVFCGSFAGHRAVYREQAEKAGGGLARLGVTMVYGGGKIGLMGAAADAALAAGGRVIGVIPRRLADREVAHGGLTELHVVSSMHERKMLMADLSDAFIALPGGYGTFEEFWEAVTWTQLGIHQKPCGLLNVDGFFDPMLAQIDRAVAEGFISPDNRALVTADDDVDGLLETLRCVRLPEGRREGDRPSP
jgi:uncharacterized protein (TIGR00730 family)